jgi:ferritin-like metal-binding protein YciE
MPTPRSPQDMLTTELKEIHSAERQLSRAIPKLSREITSDRLREMLDLRKEQGARLIDEIDQAFERMEATKGRPKNPAAEGLIEDLDEHLQEIKDESMLDAALLAGVQKLEHYCIAAWGTARSMGELLGQKQIVQAMERALDEGKKLDADLTRLAEEEINPAMLQAGQEGEARASRSGRNAGDSARQGHATH